MAAEIDFDQLFREKGEEYRQRAAVKYAARLAVVPERSLIWHALVPTWTLPLAAAAGFPIDDAADAAETFRRMENLGYSLSSQPNFTDRSRPEAASRTFSMPAAQRAEVLQKAASDSGLATLRQEAESISRKILESEHSVSLPANTARWAHLARLAPDPHRFAEFFDALAEKLFETGKSGELLDWIETARSLEQFFGSDLSFTLGRAARRLELLHRRAGDRRRLTKLLERAEQTAAVRDLLENDAGEWALHFIGAGGVGKTMLIRHLTANLSEQMNFSVARVDFDYLNPDYPARAPGLLLAQLAEEFRVFAPNSSVVSLLVGFNEKIVNLHDRFRAAPEQFSLEAAITPVFELLPIFAEALSQLPRRPVVVLDTCEELLKIRVDGSIPPSVEATFVLMEKLHEQVNSLRVIFGGRRPLAAGGAGGWRVPDSRLPAREYLRVHEIRGFTRDEAAEYLGTIEKVRADAIEPIINHSAEQIKTSRIEWSFPESFVRDYHSPEQPRYNPFDLWLYASWLHENPALPLAALETADSESYVQMRIVSRIDNADLRALLPFVALLGRFDAKTLQATSGFDENRFSSIFTELSNFEWINRQTGQTFEVENGLQPRLRSYFEQREAEEFRRARRKVVDYLETQTLAAPGEILDVSYFTLAFRLLKSESERALEWWRKMETRFASEQNFSQLRDICESILGAETNERLFDLKTRAFDSPTTLLLAAVHLSYAAAMLQTRSFGDLEQVWTQAVWLLEKHAAEEKTRPLLRRARAGRLAAAARFNSQTVTHRHLEWLFQTLRELKPGDLDWQSAGSLVAAVEAVTEFFESGQSKNLPLRWLSKILSRFSNPLKRSQLLFDTASNYLENLVSILETGKDIKYLVLFAKLLHGRWLIRAGRQHAGLEVLRRALPKTLRGAPSDAPLIAPQTFLDWLPPAQIESRIRLEFARLAYPAISAAEILQIVGDKIPEPVTIDSDRLGAAILDLRSAVGVPSSDNIDELARQSRYSVRHDPACYAHRAFPPLFAAIAEAMAAVGRVDEAVEMLAETSAASEESAASELATVQAADRALLRIVRRMRLRDEDWGANTSLNRSNELPDLELLSVIRGLSNPKRSPFSTDNAVPLEVLENEEDRLKIVHTLFRSSFIPAAAEAQAAVELLEKVIQTGSPAGINTFAATSCFLDCLEINEKFQSLNLEKPFPQFGTKQIKETNFWRETRAAESLEKLTLLLRLTALEDRKIIDDGTDKDWLDRIGRRRAANVALEEGELLALRLPERAVPLLNLAHKLFLQADDNIGAMIARVCAALACARAGDNVTLDITLSKIKQAYSRYFARSVRAVPGWEEIDAAAGNPDSKSLDQITPRGWRPWLVRLIVCLAWKKDGYRAGGRTSQINRWLEENYGVPSDSGTVLPAELEGWLKIQSRAVGRDRNEFSNEFSLAVSLTGKPAAWQTLADEAEVNFELRGAAQEFHEQFFVPGLAPYRQAAAVLADKLRQSDFTFLEFLNEQKIIKLQVDQPASWICWEAVAGLALQDLSGNNMPLFRRTVVGAKAKLPESWREIRRAATWTNDLFAAELSQVGWREAVEKINFTHEAIDSQMVGSFLDRENPPQILHVVGTPTETSAGVRLSMSGETFVQQENFETSQTSRMPDAKGSRSELRKAADLVSQFPQTSVCILQSPPREAIAGRTRRDREQAAYLRLLAAEIALSGIPVVITVAALPPNLFGEVLRRVADGFLNLQDANEAGKCFLDAIAKARQFIIETGSGNAEDLLETALDICLYAADAKK